MTDPLFPSSLLAPLYSTDEMRAVLDDRARVQRMLDFEAALARAEAAVGIVPAGHAGTIAEACQVRHYDLAALGEGTIVAGNLATPLVNALTAEVGKRSKKAAGYVHWGATSQDVVDTAMVLELRAAIDALFKDLDRATKAFTTLAGRHRRNMTMARTLLQQALPIPFGLKLAGYAAALARSRDRLRRLRKEALVLQFGGAAGTLAALEEKGLDVSERLAAQLDLTVPDAPWHTHRDRFAEVAAALAILAGTCGKIARDVALLMQTEVGEAFEPSGPGRGVSSTLPQKRNPAGAATALSAAMIAPNLAATILNAQFQEHERAVGGWQAEWATFPALALVVSGTLRAVVDIAEGLTVDVERMKANLEASSGLVMAEHVSFALAEKLGRAEAHALVAELVHQAAKDKRAFKDVVAESEKIKAHLNASELARLFMPNHYQGSAQTFIDRLVASAQGRTVRRSSSVAHLTDPKLPTARADHLSAISAATSAVKAAESAASPAPSVAAEKSAGSLGQAVAAASTLIDQTISELAKAAAVMPAKTAEPAPIVTPEPAAAAIIASMPEPEPAAAPTPEPAPAPVVSEDPAPAPEPAPTVVANAPSIEHPDEEPGALLEVFARAAENEQPEPAEPKHKTA
jgi:3-carboxy-cis,cis-muconate cycloisomerase